LSFIKCIRNVINFWEGIYSNGMFLLVEDDIPVAPGAAPPIRTRFMVFLSDLGLAPLGRVSLISVSRAR